MTRRRLGRYELVQLLGKGGGGFGVALEGRGPLGIVAMEVIDGATGESFVTEFIPPIIEGESGTVPFWPRTIWTLRAYDELGQTYTYPESALCLDGGEFYALDVVADDVD